MWTWVPTHGNLKRNQLEWLTSQVPGSSISEPASEAQHDTYTTWGRCSRRGSTGLHPSSCHVCVNSGVRCFSHVQISCSLRTGSRRVQRHSEVGAESLCHCSHGRRSSSKSACKNSCLAKDGSSTIGGQVFKEDAAVVEERAEQQWPQPLPLQAVKFLHLRGSGCAISLA